MAQITPWAHFQCPLCYYVPRWEVTQVRVLWVWLWKDGHYSPLNSSISVETKKTQILVNTLYFREKNNIFCFVYPCRIYSFWLLMIIMKCYWGNETMFYIITSYYKPVDISVFIHIIIYHISFNIFTLSLCINVPQSFIQSGRLTRLLYLFSTSYQHQSKNTNLCDHFDNLFRCS